MRQSCSEAADGITYLLDLWQRLYGLKQRGDGNGPTRHLGYKFSVEESAALLNKCRELGCTISQIGIYFVSKWSQLSANKRASTSSDSDAYSPR